MLMETCNQENKPESILYQEDLLDSNMPNYHPWEQMLEKKVLKSSESTKETISNQKQKV